MGARKMGRVGRRHGEDFWRRVAAERRREGLTLADAAARYDVGLSTVSRWMARLDGETSGSGAAGRKSAGGVPHSEAAPQVLELLADEGSHVVSGRYVVRCGKFTVEVDVGFDEATMSRLLGVVSAAC